SNLRRRSQNYGSAIVVLGTDLPLTKFQLSWLCKRATLGIGRCGSFAAYTSGEIVVGFSTCNKVPRDAEFAIHQFDLMLDALKAPIKATEEAIINSLINNRDMIGANENFVPAIPIQRLQEIMHAA